MKISGAIFDVDGTLLDSMSIWDTIGADYLRSIGYIPRENLNEIFKNMSLLQAAEYYRNEYGVTLRVEEIMSGVNAMLEQFYQYEKTSRISLRRRFASWERKGRKPWYLTMRSMPSGQQKRRGSP